MYQEINFDGIIGPTHNYAGLSEGNRASIANGDLVSRPRDAALQGLKKMKALADLGVPQAVLPPLERPSIPWLRRLGISGSHDDEVLASAARTSPYLLAASSSASSMWTANAATVAPSCDTSDRRVHLTAANLSSKLHRAIEAKETESILQTIFADPEKFVVHHPLDGGEALRDEGAANHTRLCPIFGQSGLHLFVYGCSSSNSQLAKPNRYPARQTLEASQCVARIHQLPEERTLFIQQSPEAIDAGVFHNDVISVGHCNTLLYHEKAFAEGERAIESIAQTYHKTFSQDLELVAVSELEVSLEDAVQSYLFNSQIATLPNGGKILIAPTECQETLATRLFLERLISDGNSPIQQVCYFDLRESMKNGGGPACLRQRIVLNTEEISALKGRVLLDDALYSDLENWIKNHYRDTLTQKDLADPSLLRESRTALDTLTRILELGNLYAFQKTM